jgi:hypothetical protein
VSGQVTYNGQPVTGGTITFYPQSGGAYPTSIDEKGAYAVSDLPAGEAAVSVETESVKKTATAEDYNKGHVNPQLANSSRPGGEGAAASAKKYVKIPPKYADPKTSGLTANLTAGRQEKTFQLAD